MRDFIVEFQSEKVKMVSFIVSAIIYVISNTFMSKTYSAKEVWVLGFSIDRNEKVSGGLKGKLH